MTQELGRNQCIHGRPQKLSRGGNVCAGRTSILNLLSEMFSALRLSEMLKLSTIHFCELFLQISRILRLINGPNMIGENQKS